MSLRRARDLVLVTLGAPLAGLVTLAVALVVRRSLGSPVLYRQERIGQGGRPFTMVKFRTMTDARDASGRLLPDAERVTPLGRLLRAWSLDELPELYNVARGEMSLVGPRPLPVSYAGRFTGTEQRRHDVPPGITGWSQVNGRNDLDWDERLALDVWYVDHRTQWLDLTILARTARAVIGRRGIAADGEATMRELRPALGDGGHFADPPPRGADR